MAWEFDPLSTRVNAEQKTELKKLLAKVAISYYHWRAEGFPEDHIYHMHVALYDAYVSGL